MKEEASGCWTAAGICYREEPACNGLRHFKRLGVRDQEEDEGRIEGVFGLEGEVGFLCRAWRGHSIPGLLFCCGGDGA